MTGWALSPYQQHPPPEEKPEVGAWLFMGGDSYLFINKQPQRVLPFAGAVETEAKVCLNITPSQAPPLAETGASSHVDVNAFGFWKLRGGPGGRPGHARRNKARQLEYFCSWFFLK